MAKLLKELDEVSLIDLNQNFSNMSYWYKLCVFNFILIVSSEKEETIIGANSKRPQVLMDI